MRIIIDGAGEVGSHLAKMLRAESNQVTVIDDNEQRINDLTQDADVETIVGNPTSINTLKDALVSKSDLFIAVYPTETEEINIAAALIAKQLGAAKVLARVNNEEYLNAENKLIFKEMGIELMFCPERIAADEMCDYLRHSSNAETLEFARGKIQIAVFKIDEESPVLNRRLSDFVASLSAEERNQFRVIAISRDGNTIIPRTDTRFQFGDLVFTISRREGMDDLFREFGKTGNTVQSVMILGGGTTAAMVAASLTRQDIKVKIIEKDKERCLSLSETLPGSVMIVNGDGRDSDFLYDEGIRDYDAFIALTGSDESNVLACVVAKKFGVTRTVADVENIEYIPLAEEMGVDNVINKKLITASRIFKFTLSGRARFVRYMSGTKAEVIEYTVAPGSAITKKPLKDLKFPENAIIGGVIRGSESFIAVGDTQIEDYDRVAVFALPETIREIDRFFK